MSRKMKRFGYFLAIIISLTSSFIGQVTPSAATSGGSISLYLSAPLVLGSGVSGGDVTTENFDSFSTGNCASSSNVGTISVPAAGDCIVSSVQNYGGASSASSTPAFGGAGSRFPATPWYGSGSEKNVTFTFPSPVKYLGFWWSAGNNGNRVDFYNGSTLVSTYSSDDLMTMLGSTIPNPYPGSNTIVSIGGDSYKKGHYFGNPRGFTSTSPSATSSVEPNYVFAYLNLFITGTGSFNKVVFAGPGFEFDNITTATTEKSPATSLVFIKSVLGKTVQFDANGSGTTGAMNAQSDSAAANLTSNAFSRTGYTFAGWNTLADGTGTPYSDSQSYGFTADMQLYAQWTPVAQNPTPTASPQASGASSPAQTVVAQPALASTGLDLFGRNSLAMFAIFMVTSGLILIRLRMTLRRN